MAPRESSRPPNRHRRRESSSSPRKTHHRTPSSPTSPRKSRTRRPPPTSTSGESSTQASEALSLDALERLNRRNDRIKKNSAKAERAKPKERTRKVGGDEYKEVRKEPRSGDGGKKRKKGPEGAKRRVVSGAAMEEGRGRLRGGGHSEESLEKDYYNTRRPKKKRRKRLWIIGGVIGVLVIIIIIVGAVVASKKNKKDDDDDDGGSSSSNNRGKSDLDSLDRNSVPSKWKNSYLDPWSWEDTTDFNLTFTEKTVGDLPVMGLYDDWDDSARANDQVPPLNKDWGSYAKRPARGVNIGGWLSLEPFITPSLFDYNVKEGIIDEFTLCQKLGSKKSSTLEKHYADFITEQTFKDIRDAGLDHVRIPFSYWAVETYDGDPYLFRTSWRYLLRSIEWARKYGIRVNLDLHGLPGSQNGWNHSGRWGVMNWMSGTDGDKNVERSIEIHDRLSKFFAQDRYKNVISHYGLANEPKMTVLETSDVVAWNEKVYKLVRDNGIKALVVFGDGFMGLKNWQGVMTGYDDMVLDVHQYVIFNENQIDFTHQKKVEYACKGWTQQAEESSDRSTGYGPTMFAEWSQADTDCVKYLTGVGWGNRWTGTYDTGDESTSILEPRCPSGDGKCSCDKANADPSEWSKEYKKFLKMFAEAQMHSFEKGWGWWYWTWKTESAYQWSYESGLKAGVLPEKPWDREFNCDGDVPDFEKEGLDEYY